MKTDFVDREEFDEILEDGAARRRPGTSPRSAAGAIDRNPRGGECPTWCDMAPICRIERGATVPDPEAEEDAAAA